MAEAGFSLVSSQDFVSFDDWAESTRPVAISLPGSELVRGGGGPRCMTLPIRRRPL
jgi:arginine deiminase